MEDQVRIYEPNFGAAAPLVTPCSMLLYGTFNSKALKLMYRDEDEAIVQRCVSKDSATILRKTSGSALAELRTSPQLDKITSVLLNRRPILHIV